MEVSLQPSLLEILNLEFPDCAVTSSELLPGPLGTTNAILGIRYAKL